MTEIASVADLENPQQNEMFTQYSVSSNDLNVAFNINHNLFIQMVMELYGNYQDKIDVLLNDTSGLSDQPEYTELRRLNEIKNNYPEISQLITATMLYYYYKNVEGKDYPSEEEILDNNKFDKNGNPVGAVVNQEAIANFFIKKYAVITILKSIFLYIDDRYYHDPEGLLLKSEIQKVLSGIPTQDIKNTAFTVKDLKERVMNKTRLMGENILPFIKNSYIIPTKKNTLVRYKGNVIKIPNTPATGKNWTLDAEYIDDIDTSELVKFLEDITNPEAAKILIQVGSQAISQDAKYQRCYMMLGEGGNGKSLLSKLYYKFLGVDNFSVVSMQDFKDKFRSSELCKTLLNINPDIPKTAMTIEAINAIKAHTGGDYRTFEDKYETPYKDRPTTVLLFGANGLPDLPLSEDKYSWWRRWDIIEFPKTFALDPHFEENFLSKKNVNSLFKLIVDDLDRLEKDGLIMTNTSDYMKVIWEKSANSAYAFISDNYTIEPYELEKEDWVVKNDLIKMYEEYCEDKNIEKINILSKDAFCKKLLKMKIIDKKKTMEGGQKRERVYTNLKRLPEETEQKVDVMKKIEPEKNNDDVVGLVDTRSNDDIKIKRKIIKEKRRD